MTNITSTPRAERDATLDQIIADLGALRVLIKAARALLRPAPRTLWPSGALPNHIRRDIGLNTVDPPGQHWDGWRP